MSIRLSNLSRRLRGLRQPAAAVADAACCEAARSDGQPAVEEKLRTSPQQAAAPKAAAGRRSPRRLRRWTLRGLLVFCLWNWALPWCFPVPENLQKPLPPSLILTDRHGTPLKRFLADARYRSEPVKLADLPPDLVECTLAAEDRRFFAHGGVDYLAVGRAVRDAAMSGHFSSGASTITQQLVKLSSPPAERNVWTKLREMLQARRLEMTWSKERILEEYLNRVDCGGLCRGAGAAAEHYFGKPVRELSLAECAWIAGLPQAPVRHSRRDPNGSRRHDWVLERWAALHPGHAQRAAAARVEQLTFRDAREANAAGHVIAAAAREADGNSVLRTTIDWPLQEKCVEILRSEIARLSSRNVQQGAVVVLDNATAEILVMLGSADWSGPEGQIKGALTPRSAGSTLKPFTYGLALERGCSPASMLEDLPSSYPGPAGAMIEMVNYDHRYRGPVPLREALACSLNVPAVRLLNSLGGPPALHELLRRAGFSTLGDDAAPYGLGLTIGNAEVTLLDLAGAYSALARGGEVRLPVLTGTEGTQRTPGAESLVSLESFPSLFPEATCWLLADILSDPAARSAQFGTGGPLRLTFRCAVKTGTSSDFRDNWCVGFTPEFTVGVWIGNFDGTPMSGVSGASGAAPVFHRIMSGLHERKPPSWPARPDNIITVRIDSRTGRLAAHGTEPQWLRDEFFPAVHPPLAAQPDALTADRRVLLSDAVWGTWFRSGENQRAAAYALSNSDPLIAPVISSPRDGTACRLDPEIPGGGRTLVLKSSLAPDHARWDSDTLTISADGATVSLIPGEHRLRLTDTRTGASREVAIRVVEQQDQSE